MMGSRTEAIPGALPAAVLDLYPFPVLVAVVPSGQVLQWNAAAAAGCGIEALGSTRLHDLVRAADDEAADAVPDPIERALAGGLAAADVDATLVSPSGRLPIAIAVQPIPAREGHRAVIVWCHPRERWVDAARALRRNEERLALALSAAGLGAWEFDLTTRRLTSSAQCRANHGFSAGQDMQLEPHILESIPADHRERFTGAIERAIATQGSFTIEVPNRWPDGSEHWLLVAGRVLDPTCMVGISQDITARRQAEAAMSESDRRKDEFLAVLGHELRGPLAPILTAVKLLQAKGPADPELQRLRDTIFRQTRQLMTLVDDMLDVERIAAGKLRLERTRVDLRDVAGQAAESVGALVERRGHVLTMRLPDLPVVVDGDGARLVQIAGNLLNNAAKYMRNGGEIEVVVGEQGEWGVLSVRDRGVGIRPDMLHRIFDRFVQVATSAHRAEGGLGIGLSLVKALVELHGGTVEARSAGIGHGSEFTVRLPLASAAAARL